MSSCVADGTERRVGCESRRVRETHQLPQPRLSSLVRFTHPTELQNYIPYPSLAGSVERLETPLVVFYSKCFVDRFLLSTEPPACRERIIGTLLCALLRPCEVFHAVRSCHRNPKSEQGLSRFLGASKGSGPEGPGPRSPAGRDLRPAGPERLGQNHHDQARFSGCSSPPMAKPWSSAAMPRK